MSTGDSAPTATPGPGDHCLNREDAEAIVRLLGQVVVHPGTLPEKRRAILTGLAAIIDSDGWWWVHCVVKDNRPHMFSMIDAGWRDDQQRSLATVAHHTPHAEIINPHFRDYIARGLHVTLTRRQMVPDHIWEKSPFFLDYFAPAGIKDFMGVVYPLDGGKISSIGFHRNAGKPLFSDRDRTLAHLVTSQIDWLHRDDIETPAAKVPPSITQRQQGILMLLLQGHSTKQIAARLTLSEHTVNDHLKVLHKHYHVSSRSELLSLFIHGGGDA